jgi:hypothetical protein
MRHFVQYHNSANRGPYQRGQFAIVTAKSVDSLLGDQVWLVTREGDPSRYCLCETFVVEKVDHDATAGPQGNIVSARSGRSFDPPVPIDSADWFTTLQHDTGNFAFGLQRINNPEIVTGLLRIASGNDGDDASNSTRTDS